MLKPPSWLGRARVRILDPLDTPSVHHSPVQWVYIRPFTPFINPFGSLLGHCYGFLDGDCLQAQIKKAHLHGILLVPISWVPPSMQVQFYLPSCKSESLKVATHISYMIWGIIHVHHSTNAASVLEQTDHSLYIILPSSRTGRGSVVFSKKTARL